MAGPTQFTSNDTRRWWLGFGSGVDGDLTISSNTTDAPIDASCSGTAAATSLSATNASFAVGQAIMIHQTRGTGVGQWELNQIIGYTAGTITLRSPLYYTYTDSGASQAQVIVVKQYRNVTINASRTLTAKAWDGDVGGILVFMASGTLTVDGIITCTGKGFRGGAGGATKTDDTYSTQGESGTGVGAIATAANGAASGGGESRTGSDRSGAAAGGGHASNGGAVGGTDAGTTPGAAGGTGGNAGLTAMIFGGAGGGSGANVNGFGIAGSNSGGIIMIIAGNIGTINSIVSGGDNAATSSNANVSGSGNGAGGSILLKAKTATLGTTAITAAGGTGGTASGGGHNGGVGSEGRIHLDYVVSYSGTTTPTLDVTQDLSLRQPIKRTLTI